MNFSYSELIARYWSDQQVTINLLAFANIAGAMVLGLFVGYERSFNGRAAGMRTYGLVCMARSSRLWWQTPRASFKAW